ncbi:hypothetical protein Tco_0843910 [Tanacetum coccineum]
MASSDSSRSTPPALKELIELSGESKITMCMKFFFTQEIAKEKAFANLLRDKDDDQRATKKAVCDDYGNGVNGCSVGGSWCLECLRDTQRRLNDKLAALRNFIDLTTDGIREKETHVDIMDLNNIKKLMFPGELESLCYQMDHG